MFLDSGDEESAPQDKRLSKLLLDLCKMDLKRSVMIIHYLNLMVPSGSVGNGVRCTSCRSPPVRGFCSWRIDGGVEIKLY